MDKTLLQQIAELKVLSDEQLGVITSLLASETLTPEARKEIQTSLQTFLDTVVPLKMQQLEALSDMTSLLGQYMNSVEREAMQKAEESHKAQDEAEGNTLLHQL